MAANQNGVGFLTEHREKLQLFAYFVVILGLSVPLSGMLTEAWRRAEVVKAILGVRKFFGISLDPISVGLFGLFVGFLLLMSFDPKKRVQAALLWVGLTFTLVGLALSKFLVDNISLETLPFLFLGIAAGVVIAGGRKLSQLAETRVVEFRRASKGIYIIITAIVVVAFLEHHVLYPDIFAVRPGGVYLKPVEGPLSFGIEAQGIGMNFGMAFLFVATVRQFVKYDSEQNFFLLGPRRSGKSLFLVGSYLEALDRQEARDSNQPLHPSEDLMDMVDGLNRQQSQWVVDATDTGQIKDLTFQYIHGSVFPMNIEISTIDYAGEYLSRIPDALIGTMDDDEMDDTLAELGRNVVQSDTLLLVLDAERFVNGESLEISEYFSILQQADDKDVILIATKSDLLAEQFREERGLEAHRYYDEFQQYVNEQMTSDQQVRSLINESSSSSIHPVYYQTKVAESGERIPMRDDRGTVMTVGFNQLLDRLGRT